MNEIINLNKLCIGTAQFGLDYGITNKFGKLNKKEIYKALNLAKLNNISLIDTSNSYGNAETLLGSISPVNKNFKYITKLKIEFDEGLSDFKQKKKWDQNINKSLEKLKVSRLEGLLLHRPSDLLHKKSNLILEWLLEKKRNGITNKIGVSIYDEKDLLPKHLTYFDIVQLPISIYDQRKFHSGFLEKLHKKSIEIHARSIFLQGLIIQEVDLWPSWIKENDKKIHRKFSQNLKRLGIEKIESALGWVYGCKYIDKIVVGFTSSEELEKIIFSLSNHSACLENFDFKGFSDNLLDPRTWP